MKTSGSTLLVALLAGLTGFVIAFLIYRGDSAPIEQQKNIETSASTEEVFLFDSLSSPATLQDAYRMFNAYHQTDSINTSKGILGFTTPDTTDDPHKIKAPFSAIMLGYENFLRPIEQEISGILSDPSSEHYGKEFKAYAGLPVLVDEAYNKDLGGHHSMVWLAVIGPKNSDEVKDMEFLFPDNGETVIYQYNGLCPPDCAKNEDRLWKTNWAK